MKAYHNSRELEFRNPFGAVEAGTEVTLKIDVWDTWDPYCVLRTWSDDAGEGRIPMDREFLPDRVRFTARINPAVPQLLWYRFIIYAEGREVNYGARRGQTGGEGTLWDDNEEPASFQITVSRERRVPDWYKKGVVYQIFPDRFARDENWHERTEKAVSAVKNGPQKRLVEDWYTRPDYVKTADGRIKYWDFYGGSLKGIEKKLDYLKDLGISVIYLNPIFEAASNHRYDTGDYTKIDPALGTEEDFRSLCKKAEEKGISIILDGVFNHTGCDSIYFNKFNNYDSVGAYNSPDSPYRSWYKFDDSPAGYSSWWGVDDLPDIVEDDPGYREFINGEDGIVRRWLRAGAKGWRLDVADELPDSFIEELKTAVVEEKGDDGLVIGEVWEDASNKIAYSRLRRYLLGCELDGTMNYPMRDCLGSFIKGYIPASDLTERLMSLYENYPREAFYSALNLIGSHDRVRSMTILGDAPNEGEINQWERASYKLSPEQRGLAKSRMWLAILLQMTMPGVPCIYYGDEAGMEGYADPYNRAAYPWGKEDKDTLDMYRNGIGLRRMYPIFTDGSFEPFYVGDDVFGFWRRGGDESAVVLLNRSRYHNHTVTLKAENEAATELIGGMSVEIKDGSVTLTLWQLGTAVIHFHRKKLLAAELEPGRGVLAHITSLPNKRGKGTIGEPALKFIDWLKKNGYTYWQILPVNPTDFVGSPYAGSSAFAGNTDLLGLSDDALRRRFRQFKPDVGYERFVKKHRSWLEPFAMYSALSEKYDNSPWQQWPEEHRKYSKKLYDNEKLAKKAEFYKYTQYLFDMTWQKTRAYANENGIRIIGDIPMYVAAGSADCWADPKEFELLPDGNPALVAGVPPDYFSEDGQLWGNPIYKWELMEKNGFKWWMRRFERAFELYDFVRLDHFRGFESYWAIPAGEKATKGKWVFGPGMKLFEAAYAKFGPLRLLAEDLGHVTPAVRGLLTRTGFQGTEVMQFYNGDPLDKYVPPKGKVCYSGTHDNQTLLGWIRDRYPANDEEETAEKLMKNLMSCGADVIIVPLQDILGLGDEARMNTPGTTGGNWEWQADKLN